MRNSTPFLLLVILSVSGCAAWRLGSLGAKCADFPAQPTGPTSTVIPAGDPVVAVSVRRYVRGSCAPDVYGSGVLLGRDGLMLTNRHVALPPEEDRGSRDERLATAQSRYWFAVCTVAGSVLVSCRLAELLAVSTDHDLALLRVDLPALPLVIRPESEPMREAEEIRARLGFSAQFPPSLLVGHYVGPWPVPALGDFYDVASVGGSSGGPIFDLQNRLVALVWARSTFAGRAMTFAVPFTAIRRFLLENGREF